MPYFSKILNTIKLKNIPIDFRDCKNEINLKQLRAVRMGEYIPSEYFYLSDYGILSKHIYSGEDRFIRHHNSLNSCFLKRK